MRAPATGGSGRSWICSRNPRRHTHVRHIPVYIISTTASSRPHVRALCATGTPFVERSSIETMMGGHEPLPLGSIQDSMEIFSETRATQLCAFGANKDGTVPEGRMCGGGADARAKICAICAALEEVPIYCFEGWGQLSRWSITGHLALQAQRTNTNIRTTCAPQRW